MSSGRLTQERRLRQSGNKHERYALVWLLLELGLCLLLDWDAEPLAFWPLGILAAPVFEQALDNSQQLCLCWGFTIGKETVDVEVRSAIV